MLLVTVFLLVAVVILVILYSKWRHRYWARLGIREAPECVPIFGHTTKLFGKREHGFEFMDKIYKHHGGSTFCGLYQMLAPSLLVGDPNLVKQIMIKDFDYFPDRRKINITATQDEVLSEILSNASGNHWKGLRSVMSPCFTSGRMKGMFPLAAEKANCLVRFLKGKIKKTPTIAVRKHFGNYALEVFSSIAFGIETNALEDKECEFVRQAMELFNVGAGHVMKMLVASLYPKLLEVFGISLTKKEMFYFKDVALQSIKQRIDGLYRGDLLDLLMEARKDQTNPDSKTPKYPLKDTSIVAQAVTFIIGGFDNVATILTLLSFVMAKHLSMQQKLREEMEDIERENGELSYQSVMEAKYLEAFISETLRIYSPVPMTMRQCSKDYKLPGTDVMLLKDMFVIIPIYSLQRDERYWPEPEEFRPERFFPENKKDIKSGTYMPFGIGPRNCIGMRFAQMVIKLSLAKLVLEFEISCAPGHEEIEFIKTPAVLRPTDDFSVVFTPLTTKQD